MKIPITGRLIARSHPLNAVVLLHAISAVLARLTSAVFAVSLYDSEVNQFNKIVEGYLVIVTMCLGDKDADHRSANCPAAKVLSAPPSCVKLSARIWLFFS